MRNYACEQQNNESKTEREQRLGIRKNIHEYQNEETQTEREQCLEEMRNNVREQ
jgi:hypothetical protein